MAGSLGVTSADAHREFKGEVTWYVLLAALVAASGGLLFGYDIGVTGGVTAQPAFLAAFFPEVLESSRQSETQTHWCKFNSQLLQLFTSSLFLAGILGAAAATHSTSALGRVATMRIAGSFFLAGATLTSCSVSTGMLVAGRLALGFGVGLANQAVPLYLSEIAPAKSRGALNIMFQMATTLGILSGQLMDYATQFLTPWGWRLALAAAGVPACILTAGSFVLPETPSSLLERGHVALGRTVLQNLRGADVDVEDEYEDILRPCRKGGADLPSYLKLFSAKYRAELTWAVLLPFFQQMTGINAVMFYSAPLFGSLGFGESSALYSAVIVGIVNVLATVVSIATVDRFGRKVFFAIGGIIMLVTQVAIAFILAFEFGGGSGEVSFASALVLVVATCAFVAGFAVSWGPLGWLVPSEIQPLETRSAGQSITVGVNFLATFAVGQAFLSMLCVMRYGIFLFFAGWILVMTLVVHVYLPETKGIPLEDMGGLWSHQINEEETGALFEGVETSASL